MCTDVFPQLGELFRHLVIIFLLEHIIVIACFYTFKLVTCIYIYGISNEDSSATTRFCCYSKLLVSN